MPSRRPPNKQRALPDSAVKEILRAPANSLPRDLAEQFGCHVQLVRDIRRGRGYMDVLPNLRRIPFVDRTGGCHGCVYYVPRQKRQDNTYIRNRCTLGLAELVEGGPSVGKDCSWFEGPTEERCA